LPVALLLFCALVAMIEVVAEVGLASKPWPWKFSRISAWAPQRNPLVAMPLTPGYNRK